VLFYRLVTATSKRGTNVKIVIAGVVVLLVAVGVISLIPDAIRYMKMRAM